jgi:tetratricopeptide (TPR) repeat protein
MRIRKLTNAILSAAFLGTLSIAAAAQTHAASFQSLAAQATAAREADQLDRAVVLFKKALVLRPNWAEGWWSLATIDYDRNQYAAAAREFQKLLPLVPKDGTAHALLGLCEFELGQNESALKHLREGRELGVASDAELQQVVFYHEGVLLLRAARFKGARATFSALCKMNSQSVGMMEGMGEAVLRLTPSQAPAADSSQLALVRSVGSAACLDAQKKFDDSRPQYARLLADAPDFPNLHYAFGLSCIASHNIAKAIEQFKLELARDSNHVEARLEIAAALYKSDSAAALPYAQQVVALQPQLPFAHYLLGLLLLDTDQSYKAIPELERAAKDFPREKKVFFALGSAYARVGRKLDADKARATFQSLSNQPQPDSLSTY